MFARRLTALLCAFWLAAACSSSAGTPSPTGAESAESDSGPGRSTTDADARCEVEPQVVWVEEGEEARATLACTDVVLSDDAPDGVEVSDGRISWVPGLDQAGNHEIGLEVDGASTTWSVGVADAFDDPANRPVGAPGQLTHEFGLEVLHLFPEDHLSENPVGAALFHTGDRYDAEVAVRGATSLQYPKPSLAITVEGEFRSEDPAFDGLERLVLLANFDDNSLIRNRLAQRLWAEMSPQHLDVATDSLVVYLDGSYLGVYTLVEDVDPAYLLANRLDAGPQAQLFKADDDRADFRLDDDPDPAAGFDKKNGEPESGLRAFDPISDLVEFVALAGDTRFASEIASRVDVEDVIDWIAFADFIAASDSVSKNSFWYQSGTDEPFRYVPWDFNHSFGQDWNTLRVPPEAETFAAHLALNGLFERVFEVPSLRRRLTARYEELLEGVFAPDRLGAMLDELEAELGANLDREQRRWGSEYAGLDSWSDRTDIESTGGEIDYVRSWIYLRYAHAVDELDSALADEG